MIWRYDFWGVGSSSASSRCLHRTWPLTQLLRRYTLTLCWIISCWRPRGQNLSSSFHATVRWTIAHPLVHPVLKASSWRVSVLIQTERRIDRRCPHLDHRIIRCYWLCCFFSAIHPAHLETRPSVHPTVSTSFGLLRSVPTTLTLCTDGIVGSSDGVNFLPFLRRFWPLKNRLSSQFGMWYFCILGT
jgi:hypothetical protein